MQYTESQTGKSNRDRYEEAKALLADSGIPGVKLKPYQACERVGIGLPLYYYHRKQEKGAVNSSDKPDTQSTSTPNRSGTPLRVPQADSSPDQQLEEK